MAARSDAAAHGSLFWLCTVCFLFVCVTTLEQATYIYSRMDLFDIGMSCRSDITADFHRTNNIPEDIARPPGSPWIVFGPVKQRRRRRERKQKRGCRAGLLARLRNRPHRPPLPSLFLANARSIVHKMDELEVLLAANTNVRDCCVMIITESWLHSWIPDAAVQLPGRSTHRYERNSASAFRSGDAAQYSMARANLRRGIKAAKEDYKGKVELSQLRSSAIAPVRRLPPPPRYPQICSTVSRLPGGSVSASPVQRRSAEPIFRFVHQKRYTGLLLRAISSPGLHQDRDQNSHGVGNEESG
ncbi:Imidazoleglycerol-phosphate dehydratase [Dissostichus eleginoides]|uniref:Imidazoleglycerol-phosphate dehydratase n=1 Tax=Dissostichus eleginoides TaxID=100907 RepID=A0AAD9F5C9_DISEL|nr:Imidazoleglycerol-phosphate dehydratase [Dissostichus eleginoides]